MAGGGGGGGVRPGYTAEELELMKSISELARLLSGQGQALFAVGFPAYSQAIDYYRTLLGAGGRSRAQAVTAPAAEDIAQAAEGSRRAILSGYLSGGARERALAEIEREKFAQTARLTQGVQPGAAAALGAGGLGGVQTGMGGEESGAGLYGGILSTRQQERQFQQALAEQTRQFDAQLALSREALAKSGGGSATAAAALQEQIRQFNIQQAFAERQARTQSRTALGLGIGSLAVGLITGLGTKSPGAGAAAATATAGVGRGFK